MTKELLTRLNATALFWTEALNRPREIGAIAPSSRDLAVAMAAWLPANRSSWIVELGPGTGVVTRQIIERGHAPDRLLAIELSPRMADLLRKHFPGTPVVTGDALNLDAYLGERGCQPGEVSVVFSSLPLLMFDAGTADRLAQKIHAVLRPGGIFVQYSYHLFRRQPEAARRFEYVSSRIIWPNLPPARVSVYRKS